MDVTQVEAVCAALPGATTVGVEAGTTREVADEWLRPEGWEGVSAGGASS